MTDKKRVGYFFDISKLENQKEIFFLTQQLPRYYKIKVISEFLIAFGMLLFFLIPMLVVALLIRIKIGPQVIIKQLRVGRLGVPFYLYKFRTMYIGSQSVTALGYKPFEKIENDPRVAGRFGQFLRKYKVDELPQLFNILLGDMCLIGPRPYIYEESVLIPEKYYYRYLVRPGITGPWQAQFSSDLSSETKLETDENYVQNINFKTDLKILFSTALYVWNGEKRNLPASASPEASIVEPNESKPGKVA